MKIESLTPRKVVQELDKYIIGQEQAKKSVAIALRNRWRRQQVEGELQNEITPNNIILIGPTGVGKTEIARRLSKLANAPFIKVEATKFTEVGYVGRDVESMIRELLDVSINEVRNQMMEEVKTKAKMSAKEKILDLLLPSPKKTIGDFQSEDDINKKMDEYYQKRQELERQLENGELDDEEVEIKFDKSPKGPQIEVFSNINMETMDLNIGEMIGNMLPSRRKSDKSKKMKVAKAIKKLITQESDKLVSKEKVLEIAKERVENNGIIFIDEIDKIASSEKRSGADVSRSGVQRDLLPIVEGSAVPSKHGIINTSHILFIAAGAFHIAKPSDLIPELQGRFPIRVELNSLTQSDFEKILKFPKNSLVKQYKAMFQTEEVELDFEDSAIEAIAEFALKANEKMEDIGARRLHTILNTLLEDELFAMPEDKIDLTLDREFVEQKLDSIIENEDLSKYIL